MANERLGYDWLMANDQRFAKRATEKRRENAALNLNTEALSHALSGGVVVKIGGRYVQAAGVGFEGGSEDEAGQRVPIVAPEQEAAVDMARMVETYGGPKRRGKRGGRKHRR